MKTSELTGPALDWAVAKCEVPAFDANTPRHIKFFHEKRNCHVLHQSFRYSEQWAHGGPIIERERLTLKPGFQWEAQFEKGDCEFIYASGPTLLIAAMRCFVASKLGDEVEIPKELT